MTLYRYTAISQSGGKVVGEIEAQSRDSVFDQLNELGHFPVDVQEAGKYKFGQVGGFFSVKRTPSKSQITIITRELAMLLKAGLTLDQALTLLEQDRRETGAVARLISRLRFGLNEGMSFPEVLEAQEGVFPPEYCNMIRVAEVSGTLQSVLEQIADVRERNQKLRSKVLSAILYPCFLIATAIGMIILLLTFVVPRFKEMITGTSAEIPESAKLVIFASDWLIANGQTLLISMLIGLFMLTMLWRRPSFRDMFDTALLRLPVIGYLARISLMIRFFRTMGTLLKSGVDLPVALGLCQRIVGVRPAEAAIGESIEALRKGQNFIDPLAKSLIFLPVAINMLRVGEETGSLSSSTLYLAQMFEDKFEVAIQRLMTILEPLIIILVSLFVAGIIVAILGAVISVNDLVI